MFKARNQCMIQLSYDYSTELIENVTAKSYIDQVTGQLLLFFVTRI